MNIPPASQNSILKTPEQLKSIIQNSSNSIRNTSSNISSNFMNSVNKLTNNPETIIGLIILILIALTISYIMYNYIANTLFNQSKLIIAETKIPILANIKTEINIDNNLKSGNGLKRSYTFWIYIKDLDNDQYKNVLYLGDSYKNASPIIFFDSIENKLYVRFSKKDTSVTSTVLTLNEYFNNINNLYTYMKQGIRIEYIPIQRWVHVGIVVNDIGSGSTISSYIDGDLVDVVTNDDPIEWINKINGESNHKYDLNNLILDSKEKITIGGNINSLDADIGFQGLICKFSIYNYDLNYNDIRNDYNKGPIDSILAKLGLGSYGVRSPIYKIS
jgi:hypothetical protein